MFGADRAYTDFVRANGTKALPTAVINGDRLGSIIGGGYYNSTDFYRATQINFLADQNFSLGNAGSNISFDTTSIGSTTRTERMRIDSSGNVGIGTSSTTGVKLGVVGNIIRLTPPDDATSGFSFNNSSSNTTWQSMLAFKASIDGANNFYVKGTGEGYFAGNVGIGTSSPSQKLDVSGGAGAAVSLVRAAAGQNAFFSVAGNGNAFLSTSFDFVQDSTNFANIAQRANAAMAFSTNNTERMRIDASGNLLVGKTSAGTPSAAGDQFGLTTVGYNESVSTNAGGTLALWYMNRQSSAGSIIDFRQNLVTVGSITVTASATLYNVTSDQRLKNDLGIVTETNIIDDTVIHDFTWKSNNTQSRGVFAQEAVKVNPSAVSVGDDGEEVTNQWQVDYSKYVPDLIVHAQKLKKQVQEQQALIEALTARLTKAGL
jgi:hypothetical protein